MKDNITSILLVKVIQHLASNVPFYYYSCSNRSLIIKYNQIYNQTYQNTPLGYIKNSANSRKLVVSFLIKCIWNIKSTRLIFIENLYINALNYI